MADDLSIVKSEALPELSIAKSEPIPEQHSALERFIAPAVAPIKALFKPSDDPNEHPLATFGKNVIDMVKALPAAQQRERDAMHTAWNAGDHVGAVAHGIAALTPVLGPMSQDAATKWIEGDHAGAVGTFALMAAPELADAASPALGAAGKTVGKAAGAVSDASLAPGTREVVGIFSPRLKHVLDVAARAKSAYESAPKTAPVPEIAKMPQPEPMTPAMQRVSEAFDPSTARIAPPTTAPGNAVYEHGPVDMPQPEAVPPGAPQAPQPGGPVRFSESGPVGVPLSEGRIGPRQAIGGQEGPIRPGSSGLELSDDLQRGAEPQASISSQPVPFEPPHPAIKTLAEKPGALEAAKAFRDALQPKGDLPESITDQNTNGTQIQPYEANKSAVSDRYITQLRKGGASDEDIIRDIMSREDQPAAHEIFWRNHAQLGKVTAKLQRGEKEAYMPSSATQGKILDALDPGGVIRDRIKAEKAK